jgi:hypothetical protein
VIKCPSLATTNAPLAFTFRATPGGCVGADASEPADATEPTTPCDLMTLAIDGRRWPPLLGGASFVHAAQQVLRINLQR